MLDGSMLSQNWVGIGLTALAIVLVLWLMKNLIKWLFILAIVGFCVWRFWLS